MAIALRNKYCNTSPMVIDNNDTGESKNPEQPPLVKKCKASNDLDAKKFGIGESKVWNGATY